MFTRLRLARLFLLLTVLVARPATAGLSFEPVPLHPDHPLERLTQGVAQERLGRRLFGDPLATTMVGTLELFADYPYVRARYVQLVADRQWNRLLLGGAGGHLRAWDGSDSPAGPLAGPEDLDRDPAGRVFVADTGNDRVLVLQLGGDPDGLGLQLLYTIDGLSRPAGVAWDGRETPLNTADDYLWVADTGRHRVVCFALGRQAAHQVATFGSRGNGRDAFLEPRSVAVGPGALYVGDWGNGRLVKLERQGDAVVWQRARTMGTDLRGLAADPWGNVYAALRGRGLVRKLNPALEPLVDAHLPGVTDLALGTLRVIDHRSGQESWTAYSSLAALERWGDDSGGRRLALGADLVDFEWTPNARGATGEFILTDRAAVEVAVYRGQTLLRRVRLGELAAGRRRFDWDGTDTSGRWVGTTGCRLEVSAASLYPDGRGARASRTLAGAPGVPALHAASPNPARPTSRLSFFIPETGGVNLEVVDVVGRVRRQLLSGVLEAGDHSVFWDGRDGGGRPVAQGVYFLKLEAQGETTSRKLTVVR